MSYKLRRLIKQAQRLRDLDADERYRVKHESQKWLPKTVVADEDDDYSVLLSSPHKTGLLAGALPGLVAGGLTGTISGSRRAGILTGAIAAPLLYAATRALQRIQNEKTINTMRRLPKGKSVISHIREATRGV